MSVVVWETCGRAAGGPQCRALQWSTCRHAGRIQHWLPFEAQWLPLPAAGSEQLLLAHHLPPTRPPLDLQEGSVLVVCHAGAAHERRPAPPSIALVHRHATLLHLRTHSVKAIHSVKRDWVGWLMRSDALRVCVCRRAGSCTPTPSSYRIITSCPALLAG